MITTGTNAPTIASIRTVNSLKFTGTETLGFSGGTLTVTGVVPSTSFGINFAGTTDLITGFGTITVANGINVATGGSAIIAASGGTLEVSGVLSKAGTGTIGLQIASAGAVLKLDSAGSNVTSVAYTQIPGRWSLPSARR